MHISSHRVDSEWIRRNRVSQCLAEASSARRSTATPIDFGDSKYSAIKFFQPDDGTLELFTRTALPRMGRPVHEGSNPKGRGHYAHDRRGGPLHPRHQDRAASSGED